MFYKFQAFEIKDLILSKGEAMIIQSGTMSEEVKATMRGGPGNALMKHIIAGETLPHGRLFSEIILEPGAGIGEHTHTGETEYYYILEGSGSVVEKDGEKRVSSGDVVITGDGESHSILNDGETTLRFIAIILFD